MLIGNRPARGWTAAPRPTGRRAFTIDVQLPGMLTAMVAHPPLFGATVEVVRRHRGARQVKGVVDVVDDPTRRRGGRRRHLGRAQGPRRAEVEWDEAGPRSAAPTS